MFALSLRNISQSSLLLRKFLAMKLAQSRYLPIVWMLFILALSIVPLPHLPKIEFNLIGIDKLVHAFFYFVLTYLWHRVWSHSNPSFSAQQKTIFSLLIALVYGLGIEIVQEYGVTNRHFELDDLIANCIGSLFANIWLNYNRLKLAKV